MRVLIPLVATLTLSLPAVAADLDPRLPPDTVSYFRINAKQILASRAAKRVGVENLKLTVNSLTDIDALLRQLGFDPLKQLDVVQLIAVKDEERDALIILSGLFDAATLKKAAEDEKCQPHKVELDDKTPHVVYEVKLGNRRVMYVASADNKTLLVSPGKEYVVAALNQARARKALALKDKQLQAVLEKLDPKQSVTLAMRGSAIGKVPLLNLPGLRLIGRALGRVQILGAGVAFGNEIKFEVAGSTKDEDAGDAMRETIGTGIRLGKAGLNLLGKNNTRLVLLGEVLDTVKVGGKGRLVSVSGVLTADVLDETFRNTDD